MQVRARDYITLATPRTSSRRGHGHTPPLSARPTEPHAELTGHAVPSCRILIPSLRSEMTGASTSNYIASDRGTRPRRQPLVPSTSAPQRLTPTGITTNPSGGRKKIRARGRRTAWRTPGQPLDQGRRVPFTAPSPNLPDQIPCLGGSSSGGVTLQWSRIHSDPLHFNRPLPLWRGVRHLPLSLAGTRADRHLRRASSWDCALLL